jgi:RsiW-degrading membrane proteinase PrsW (M82 family)
MHDLSKSDNRFRPVMARLSDEQLEKVLLERRDYVPEALLACEAELRARGLSTSELEALEAEGKALEAAADAIAELPLSQTERLLYFIFAPMLFTPLVGFFYRRFAEKGEEQRAWDSITMVLLGNLFYLAAYGVIQRFLLENW